MRLDKYLSHALLMSRKDVKKLVRSSQIKVNNIVIKDESFHIDENSDEILWNDERINYQQFVYYMLHKPKGVVSATKDNVYPTVLSLLEDQRTDLFPIGRLDVDTTGLLIISNDGELAHCLLSPKYHKNKVYQVQLALPIDQQQIDLLIQGVAYEDDNYKPARVEVISERCIHLTIQEGKFHQVKRMMKAVGNEVIELSRIAFGELELDEALKLGEYRELSLKEIECLKGKSN
ncbi:MAG: pseudouridine synthase [Erysipelotrichaceae bacterium]